MCISKVNKPLEPISALEIWDYRCLGILSLCQIVFTFGHHFSLLSGPLTATARYTTSLLALGSVHSTVLSVCVRIPVYLEGISCEISSDFWKTMASKLRRAPLFKYEGNLCVRSVFPENQKDVSFVKKSYNLSLVGLWTVRILLAKAENSNFYRFSSTEIYLLTWYTDRDFTGI